MSAAMCISSVANRSRHLCWVKKRNSGWPSESGKSASFREIGRYRIFATTTKNRHAFRLAFKPFSPSSHRFEIYWELFIDVWNPSRALNTKAFALNNVPVFFKHISFFWNMHYEKFFLGFS
jgi:hypothetical protein